MSKSKKKFNENQIGLSYCCSFRLQPDECGKCCYV